MSQVQNVTNIKNTDIIKNNTITVDEKSKLPNSIINNDIVEIPEMGINETESAAISNAKSRIGTTQKALENSGCYALKGVATSAYDKVKSIGEKLDSVFQGLNNEIASINQDKSLTKEEKEEKIALIKAKKQVLLKESEAKIQIIEKITSTIMEMMPMFLMLQAAGANTNELTNLFKNIINSIDSSPSNLKNIKNSEELDKTKKENMKNILGKNTEEKIKKAINDIDKKISKREEKMKDQFTNYSDKVKFTEEIKVFEIEKRFLLEISEHIKNLEKD